MNEVNNIPEGWVETTLEEVVESANTGLDAIKRAPIVEEETGLKCFRIQDASQKKEFTNWGNTLVENKNYNKFKLIEGDILIARTGNTIGVHYLVKQNLKSVFNNGLIRLRANRKIDYKFLYKIIESGSFERFIQSIAYGTSTQPNMQINVLLSFKISLPPLPEQKSIAAILTSFDDKIELLQAQNKTLEELAQTVFKEWFGKYKVGDELPEGWRIGKLGEVANLKSGFAFKAEDFIDESNFKAIKIKDLKGNGNISLSDISAITEEITKLDRVQYFKLDEGDILLAMSGNTTGKIGVLPSSENEIYLNQRVGKFFMKEKKYNSFLYNFLMSGSFEEKILAMGYGSAQPNINPSQIENIDIIYPDETKINDYLKISKPIFEKVLQNNTQIQTLTKTRDELLPKLMSGEIRVKKQFFENFE